jgi:Kelch motif.
MYLGMNEAYEPETNRWIAGAPMLIARCWLAVGVVNGKLYAVGGYNGYYLATNEEFEPPYIEGLDALKTWLATRD